MMRVTREFADRVAEVAQLLKEDEFPDETLHRLQFDGGAGPVVETLRHNELRRIDDTRTEERWQAFCRAAADAGFRSCLVLPLRTDRQPAGAAALYGREPDVFRGSAHDIALLFAAQDGTAMRNAALYRARRRMVSNLHAGLESRAVIEQPRASCTPSSAFPRGGLRLAAPLFPEHEPAGPEDLCPACPGTHSSGGARAASRAPGAVRERPRRRARQHR